MTRRRTAALRGVALLATVVVAVASPARAEASPAPAAIPVLHLDGRGFGHGVGLSQWGAEHMARAGRDHHQILSTFYPGTTPGQAGGHVRVSVFTSPNGTTTFHFPEGGEVRSSLSGAQRPGFPVKVGRGGRVRVTFDGSYRVDTVATASATSAAQTFRAADGGCVLGLSCPTDPPTTTTTRPGGGGGGGGGCLVCTTTTTTVPAAPTTTTARPTTTTRPATTSPPPAPPPGAPRSGAPVWAVPSHPAGHVDVVDRGRGYRGAIEATAGAGPLRAINQVDIEAYLKGMAEVPSSWPRAAIAAQTVAARTWALRAMQSSGELCDYDRCQVYVGVTREHPNQSAAVDATRGQVLRFGQELASTVYSADAGGISATTLEGFGTPDGRYPYLTTVRYETDNPLPWRRTVALGDLAARFGYGGTIQRVTISDAGPSGRALAVTLAGTAGERVVPGRTFASRLGLRSTLFSPKVGTAADAPPLAPVDPLAEQALPDDADAITDAARMSAAGLGVGRSLGPKPRDTAGDLARHPAAVLAVTLIGVVTVLAARGLDLVPHPAATVSWHRWGRRGRASLRRWRPPMARRR
jgi:SpoIID/LytB domain protein